MRLTVEAAQHHHWSFDAAAPELDALFDQRDAKAPHLALEGAGAGERAVSVGVSLDDGEQAHRRADASADDVDVAAQGGEIDLGHRGPDVGADVEDLVDGSPAVRVSRAETYYGGRRSGAK